jgi:hypothetical protein
MKLRYLATVVAFALTTVALHAQVGLYFNPIAIRVSNSVVDTGDNLNGNGNSYAFLGQNSTSNVFYGYNLGGYYDFLHSGKLDTGFDVRFSDLHANNAMLRNFLVGLRVSGKPFSRPFRPYLEATIGDGSSKAPNSTLHISKVDYAFFGGVDYSIAKHVEWRVAEIGYGALTTVSSATVGAGGTVAIPPSKLVNFSTGLVFRF